MFLLVCQAGNQYPASQHSLTSSSSTKSTSSTSREERIHRN